MRLVLDMNLGPDWVAWLRQAGHEAVHWSDVGDPAATDETIIVWARQHDHVVVTTDLDFGTRVATSGETTPSVVQFRTRNTIPSRVGAALDEALRFSEAHLISGAILTVEGGRHRVRMLSAPKRV